MNAVILQRLSGSAGLANAVSAALACDPAYFAQTLLVFDFDRTLTNGISLPGDEVDLEKVVRGGEATVAALRHAAEVGAGLYIITARHPSRLAVEQLFASMDNAQAALSPFFPRGDGPPVEFQIAGGQGAIPLARGGHVYAADYQKAVALAHIIQERGQEGLRVFFFDDSVVNSYVVGTTLAEHLESGGSLAPDVAELTSYWWDSFEEETSPTPSMAMSPFGTTDSNYAEHMRHMLLAYGVSAAECEARIEVYRSKGNARHCLQRGKNKMGSLGAGPELASIEAANKVSRTKMSSLEGTLGARFARGPRPPPVLGASGGGDSRGISNSAYDTFEADKALYNPKLDTIRAAAKKSGRGSGLGALLGARGPPRFRSPATTPVNSSTSAGVARGWRAKAAAQKARASEAVSLFGGRSVASLPPGPLSAPHWETAFQVESPDEGVTGGLAFIATLAGAFVVKSVADVAEEYFGTKFLRAAGVPVPDMRVVFPHEAEHASILAAVEEVAKQYSRRGDADGGTRIMVHVLVAMRKCDDSPLLLMELVPAAVSLSKLGTAQRARQYLEPAQSSAETRVRARLEAMGRVWVADAALNFRDRFASRLSLAGYDDSVAFAEGRASSAPASAALSPLQMKTFLTGNLDNFLLTRSPLAGTGRDSAIATAGAAAIDSHVKLVKGSYSDAVALEKTRESTMALLRTELGALLNEAESSLACPSPSLGWLRFTVEVVSGHVLSDGALAAARLGALRGIAAMPSAVAWARSELAAARNEAMGYEKWEASLTRIDEEALTAMGETFEGLLAEHSELLKRLSPAVPREEWTSCTNCDEKDEGIDADLLAEAKQIGALPRLWSALAEKLRKALVDERVRGVSPGPHSVAWPGWETSIA